MADWDSDWDLIMDMAAITDMILIMEVTGVMIHITMILSIIVGIHLLYSILTSDTDGMIIIMVGTIIITIITILTGQATILTITIIIIIRIFPGEPPDLNIQEEPAHQTTLPGIIATIRVPVIALIQMITEEEPVTAGTTDQMVLMDQMEQMALRVLTIGTGATMVIMEIM
jgi:hypothetical protein